MKSNQDQPSRALGAYVADTDEEKETIGRWLVKCGVTASNYTSTCADELIRLIEERQFEWIVVASAGRAFLLPDFTRFFRVLIETDTELWTADNDRCFSVDLFCFAFENWDFLSPFACADGASTSLTSQADMLRRIESRVREVPSLVVTACKSMQHPMEMRLSPKEEELLAAAGPAPLRGEALAYTAGHQYDGHTKAALSTLVKFGCLAKTKGGYIRSGKSHDKSGLTFPTRQ